MREGESKIMKEILKQIMVTDSSLLERGYRKDLYYDRETKTFYLTGMLSSNTDIMPNDDMDYVCSFDVTSIYDNEYVDCLDSSNFESELPDDIAEKISEYYYIEDYNKYVNPEFKKIIGRHIKKCRLDLKDNSIYNYEEAFNMLCDIYESEGYKRYNEQLEKIREVAKEWNLKTIHIL